MSRLPALVTANSTTISSSAVMLMPAAAVARNFSEFEPAVISPPASRVSKAASRVASLEILVAASIEIVPVSAWMVEAD